MNLKNNKNEYLRDFYQQIMPADINDSLSTNDEAQRIHGYYENLIALLPGHIYWLNRENVFLGCNNEQALDVGLKSRHEIVGKTLYDFDSFLDVEAIVALNNRVIATGLPHCVEETVRYHFKGQLRQAVFLSHKMPLYNHARKVIGIIGVSTDITAQKQLEELKCASLALEKTTTALQLISNNIGFAINTNLAAININFDLLKLKLRTPKYRKCHVHEEAAPIFKNIENAISGCKKEVNILLTKMHHAAGIKLPAQKHPINSMRQTIVEALTEFPFVGNERACIEFFETLPCAMDLKPRRQQDRNLKDEAPPLDFNYAGEKTCMKHVLFNLLQNSLWAIKEADKGKIFILLKPNKNYNRLIFKDTGSGMTKEIENSLFTPFRSSRTEKIGLGLAFCKMMLTAHGGSITCKTKLGQYTRFTLRLPNPKPELLANKA